MDELPNRKAMQEAILKDYPRMTEEGSFRFACGKQASCFTQCCADVNIVLTPYDLLRMKNRLGISSGEFLERYAVIPFSKEQRLPVVLLKMLDDERKACPFVNQEGCSIYEDRPWACRMYPVGVASPKSAEESKFYFLIREKACQGYREGSAWTVRSWMENQGVGPYDELGEGFKEITLHDHFLRGGELEPGKMEMFHMVCYDLDRFRRFVFETSFLKKFEVDAASAERARTDDVELMKLGFRWLKVCLFGEKALNVRDEVRQRLLQAMGERQPVRPR
jgi:hypothetical protein